LAQLARDTNLGHDVTHGHPRKGDVSPLSSYLDKISYAQNVQGAEKTETHACEIVLDEGKKENANDTACVCIVTGTKRYVV
jgi:hypothetical protein